MTKSAYIFILCIMNKNKIVVITGASSGIGLATAKKFLSHGHTVYGLSLGTVDQGFECFECDVTNTEKVAECLKTIFERHGRIDVFINNAGMGVSGAVEFVDKSKNQKQIGLNLEAMIDCSRQVIPYMKKQGGGHIMFTSSVASIIPLPFQAVYSASKAGVNLFCMALGIELAPFNIKVSAVLPGDTKTGFTAAREKVEIQEGYQNRVQKSVARMEKDEQKGASPDKVAAVFYAQANKKHPKPLVCVGFSYKLIAFLQKVLPTRFMLFIVKKLYG